jgi:CubicO group peptidase (beta-lactamase class C family)
MGTKENLDLTCWPAANARFAGYQFAQGFQGELSQFEFGGVLGVSDSQEVTAEAVFDLASVTKLYTATLAANLHAKGEVDLDSPISSWSNVAGPLGEKSGRSLLTHSSGLAPEWLEKSTRLATIESLLMQTPDPKSEGSLVYSCTGYSLYALALEQKYSLGFDELVSKHLLEPLGLTSTGFNPDPSAVAIADARALEETFAFGLVHDPRARAMAGVSGNAGLFATASDVFSFLSEVLTGAKGVVLDAARKELFTPTVSGEWQQGIGFRHQDVTRLGDNSHYFSHTGFTGTLVMVDPQSSHVAVLLTNRLQCGTTREQMAPVYRAFANSL